ncbi:uncharacterized protein LOC110985426 [Acanthaster planci]|uniref:Uncharacterized protein LOC110985426 n=1 Tax=Acanthaster planci TaxID=133434 RepID=A0A8B7ZBD1_ACAPL|nr:uncharacterized protein LOC110985426 [Acanthaster planci]
MSTRKIGSHLNFVHNDEIWKDHVRHELQSLRKWPEQWGLMTREYTRLNRRLIGEKLTPEPGDSIYPTRCPSSDGRGPNRSASSSSQRSTPGFSSTRLPSILGGKSTTPMRPPASEATPKLSKLPAISQGTYGDRGPVSSTGPFPLTTSGEIGWQSARHVGNRLEIYGRYAPNARGQHGILKLLNWPQQSIM